MDPSKSTLLTYLPLWLSIIGTLTAVTLLVRTFLVGKQSQDTALQADIGHLQERCSLLEMKMGMFWRMVEEHLSTMLKKPTHLEMDALLEKLRLHTLTLEECYRLRRWLHAVYLEPDSQDTDAARGSKRIIAILVTGAVEALIQELEHHA